MRYMMKNTPMMRLLVPFLLILTCYHVSHMIHAQTQDSCTSNSNLGNLNSGDISFNTTSLTCIPVWSSEDFILRYSQAGPNLWSFVLSAPNTNSYIAMGFSPNGRMVGSSAIVGWMASDGSANMKRYFLGGQTTAQVLPDQGDLEIIGNTSTLVSSSSRLYMAFQVVTNQPSQRLLYAVGDSTSPLPRSPNFRLAEHRSETATRLNYASGQGTNVKAPYSNLKRTHGILNMLGWGILIPIGVAVARYLKHLDPIWFYAHSGIQSLGFIFGLSGVISGFVLEDRLDDDVGKHKGLGIAILVFGCLQILALLVRPSIDAKMRKYWNWYHHNVGRIMIVMVIVNIFYGIHVAEAGSSWNAGYGVFLGIYVITVLVLEIRMHKKK